MGYRELQSSPQDVLMNFWAGPPLLSCVLNTSKHAQKAQIRSLQNKFIFRLLSCCGGVRRCCPCLLIRMGSHLFLQHKAATLISPAEADTTMARGCPSIYYRYLAARCGRTHSFTQFSVTFGIRSRRAMATFTNPSNDGFALARERQSRTSVGMKKAPI